MFKKKFYLTYCIYLATHLLLCAQEKTFYFTAVQGASGKVDSVIVETGDAKNINVRLTGSHADHFRLIEKVTHPEMTVLRLGYQPPEGFKGISQAILLVDAQKGKSTEYALRGMGLPGLEGANEATLEEIFGILDLKTSPGWESLANHIRPELQGDEIPAALFEKEKDGPVSIIPIARFSPPWILPFGYYHNTSEGPELKQVGILAESNRFHEHQTLYPGITAGTHSFDPGDQPFGFYVVSPTHTSYSEDIWNQLKYPDYAGHSTRIYPAINWNGKNIEGTYLVCFEEAKNGDYQDYVFLVKNIRPVNPESQFTPLLQQNDLSGWEVFLQSKGINNDPEKIFTVKDGILHDIGKELGYVITDQTFTNYHFRLQFRWGEKKWPPRDQAKRDSGICYHIPEDEEDRIWPQSVECQIQEGDVGDFWLLGYSTIQVGGQQNPPLRHSRMVKSKDNERPNGEWNTVEVLSFQGTCVHIVNGVVVNYGTNSSLRKGRILLQSEYAELFYRNVEIREL